MGGKIVITGSYNASIFLKGDRIPQIGETCTGTTYFSSAGGKGSNQAIAAVYQGGNVKYVGKLGNDTYAQEARSIYRKLGMDAGCIYQDDRAHTGIAVIFIDDQGNNSIMVVPGANLRLTADEILDAVGMEEEVFMAGFQLENDVQEICTSICRLHGMGIQTLLDPAPAVPLPREVYPSITVIKPNEHEAALLSGIPIRTKEDALRAGEWFLGRGVKAALITLGAGGSVLVTGEDKNWIPAPRVEAVDSTGAGDIFSGSFMAALGSGKDYLQAARQASCAAALSVTRMGVLEAMPTEQETLELMNKEYGL